ncbi:MAG: RNA methyltransferase [Vicinamibacterales bacterium]|nr:RNA methyltransferase [Vicinamibacterales bacterium]
MVPIEYVQQADDPRIADYRGVPDPVLLRERGVFVAEGRLVVRTLLAASRCEVASLLVTPQGLEALGDLVAGRPELRVFVAGPDVLAGIVGFNVHRGCLAVGRRPAPVSVVDTLRAASGRSLIVVLEQVGNADNVGAIFRNARAFGAGCVLLSPGCCDPLYRKAIRVSIGASLRVPFAEVGTWPEGLEAVRAAGYELVALTPHGVTDELLEFAAARPRRVALLVGHDGDGLTAGAIARADRRVRIGMARGVDSVNVAAAAAIAMYVCARGMPGAGVEPDAAWRT